MRLIDREELKERLDRGDDLKLVMALHDWSYRAKHIPGTIHFDSLEEALQALKPEDEIVVYCATSYCAASIWASAALVDRGYRSVRRYAGGLMDWEEARYPLEGEAVLEPAVA